MKVLIFIFASILMVMAKPHRDSAENYGLDDYREHSYYPQEHLHVSQYGHPHYERQPNTLRNVVVPIYTQSTNSSSGSYQMPATSYGPVATYIPSPAQVPGPSYMPNPSYVPTPTYMPSPSYAPGSYYGQTPGTPVYIPNTGANQSSLDKIREDNRIIGLEKTVEASGPFGISFKASGSGGLGK